MEEGVAAVAEQPEVVLGRCWCGCDEIYRSGKGCNIDSCVYVVFLLEGYCTILVIVFGPLPVSPASESTGVLRHAKRARQL
jgi:hypothetical protein